MGALAPGSAHARPSAQAPIDNLIFFCDSKLLAKFQNPRTTPSVRKYVAQNERKGEKKNNSKYSGNFVPQQCQRAVHSLYSDHERKRKG
jgi:hypothetical protein